MNAYERERRRRRIRFIHHTCEIVIGAMAGWLFVGWIIDFIK